jgi:Xaa-Pro dipeptidase
MNSRLSQLVDLMKAHNFDGIVLNPGPTLTWLTGLQFHIMERPVLGLLSSDGNLAEPGKSQTSNIEF